MLGVVLPLRSITRKGALEKIKYILGRNNNATMVKVGNKVIAGVQNYPEIHMFEGHGHLPHPGAT